MGLPNRTTGLTIPLAQVETLRRELVNVKHVEIRPLRMPDAARNSIELVFIDGTPAPFCIHMFHEDSPFATT